MDDYMLVFKEHTLLFYACLEKVTIDFKRYIINSLSTVVSLFLTFAAIYLGISTFVKGEGTFDPQQLIIGYIQWMFCVYCYQNIAESVVATSRQGTIQKLYLSPIGYKWYLFYDSLSYFMVACVEICVVLTAIRITFNSTSMTILWRYLEFIPVLTISLVSILGLGYAFGGIALLLKKVNSFLYIFQYIFAMMLIYFRTEVTAIYFMPYTYGAYLIRTTMAAEKGLGSLSLLQIAILALNSIAYLVVGLIIFSLCERHVLKKGTLGHF